MSPAVLIRRAAPGDAWALHRLAELESVPPLAGEVLVAFEGREPLAALSRADGRIVADPFRATKDLVELLELRASQLVREASRRPRPRGTTVPLRGARGQLAAGGVDVAAAR
jgi:hypothetical protein